MREVGTDASAGGGSVARAALGPTSPKAGSKSKVRTPPQEIIDLAQQTERDTGIPASVTLGQWALESSWGKRTPGNNPFGIKAGKGQPSIETGTHEKAAHGSTLVKTKAKFRKFDSLADAFKARGELLSSKYPLAMEHTDDPDAFVRGLEADPHHQYATDPDYVKKITGTMRKNDFYQYDLGNGPRINDGEPSIMIGPMKRMAAHVESPHTGGGKLVEGSQTVFVGPNKLAMSREGDATSDQLHVKDDVQPDVFVG